MQGSYNVLFLCTGNSARSIMAEAILNFKGRPNFRAYSAGSHPSGNVRPEALRQLEIAHIPTQGLRSKPWDEFSRPGRPSCTLCSPCATTQPRKFAPCGRANRRRRIGEFPIQQRCEDRRRKSSGRFARLSCFLTVGSACFFVCHWEAWTGSRSRKNSTTLVRLRRPRILASSRP